jgi:site-specific DNA recombinase
MIRVGIYARVSTDEQAKEGFSIPAQKERLRAFCESQGWRIEEEYIEEGWSAKNLERPQLQKLLKDVKRKKVDIILVYRLDRLTRSVLDLYSLMKTFEDNDVSFRSATEVYDTTTAMGRLFITLVGALAQWERENLGERVKFGMEQMVSEGRKPGGFAPYGYKYQDGKLIIIKEQAEIIKKIFNWYLSGVSFRGITKKLETPVRVLSPFGCQTWNNPAISHILKNPTYHGTVHWDGLTSIGIHESIIDEETFSKVQKIIKEKSGKYYSESKGRYPFTGTLRCGECGMKMVGKKFINRKKEDRVYYRCGSKSNTLGCTMPYFRQDVFEPQFIDYIHNSFNNEAKVEEFISKHIDPSDDEQDDIHTLQDLKKQLEKTSKQKSKWYELFNDPDSPIPKDDLFNQIKPLVEKEKEIQEQIFFVEENTKIEKVSIEDKIKEYRNFKEQWNKGDATERKQLIQAMFEYVVIYKNDTVDFKLK